MCDVDIDGVISTPDAPSIYDIPKVLHREELDAYVVRRLNLPFRDVDWTQWDDLLQRVHDPQETVRIALVGKYIDLSDAYLSVAEALRAGGFKHRAKVEMRWVASDDCETEAGAAAALERRARRADSRRIRHSRHRGQDRRHLATRVSGGCRSSACASGCSASSSRRPARSGSTGANSAEFDPKTPDPVISTMADQRDAVAGEADLGGTMRLGAYPAVLEPGSIVAQAYQATEVSERHRHRYEVNNEYRDRIARERVAVLRHLAGRASGRVRRVRRRRPSVHRRHPGAPGAQEPAHPAASAVRRVHRRRAGVQGRGTAAGHGHSRAARTVPSMPTTSGNCCKSPRLVAEHEFETVDIRNPLHRKHFRAACRRGADAARQHRAPRSGRALRRGRRRRARRRQQRRAGLPVPPSAGPAAVGTARRAAGPRR